MDRDLDAGHHQRAERQSQYNRRLEDHTAIPHVQTRPDSSNNNIHLSGPARQPSPAATTDASAANHVQHAYAPMNPDDFYKSFRALHFDNNPDSLPMASSSVPRPSLRSNGNGTTPRHPVVPQVPPVPQTPQNHATPRATVRSVSNPVNTNLSGKGITRPSPTGSVRDMAKRFDQANSPSSIPRASTGSRAKTEQGNGAQSYASIRNTGAREGPSGTSSGTSGTSRAARYKSVAEDHVSNNAQSFASRVGKPKAALGTSVSSGSVIQTKTSGPQSGQKQLARSQTDQSAPIMPSSQPLLFGEILPDQRDFSTAGFGIDGLRPRRTSESNTHGSAQHQRSLSDPDINSQSPADWYRSLNDLAPEPTKEDAKTMRTHARSQSHNGVGDQHIVQDFTLKIADPPASAAISVPNSKLPVSVRTLNSPANSSSSPSTRSNSPSTSKRPQTNGKTPYSTNRAKTPVSRAKTPTQALTNRKPVARPVTPGNGGNTRLKAYIAAPTPKLSPTLRSSRPRQPVSEATTASSRMRASDRAKSPGAAYTRAAAKSTEPQTRRRKISLGPIDFAQRREHIKLAYSKSVRESQAQESRRQAAEKRQKEMEAAAKAKTMAEAVALASALPPGVSDAHHFWNATSSEGEMTPIDEKPRFQISDVLNTQSDKASSDLTAPSAAHDTTTRLIAATSEDAESQKAPQAVGTPVDESPTLGVPGSFPLQSPPVNSRFKRDSTGSADTETTEFDAEPQIALPTEPDTSLVVPITIVAPPSPNSLSSPATKAEYQYPFLDEPETPEQSPTQGLNGQKSRQQDNWRKPDPIIPGAFMDDDEITESPSILENDDQVDELQAADTIPFPRIQSYQNSECLSDGGEERHSSHFRGYEQDEATTDACTEDSDNGDKTTDCGLESRADDSVCESSDADSPDPRVNQYSQMSATLGASTSLSVPHSDRLNDRLSQQSTWTDLSVESVGRSDSSRSPAACDDESSSPVFGHATIYEPSPRPKYESSTFSDPRYSSDIRPSYDSARSSTVLRRHQLPDMDIGEGFTIPYVSQAMSREMSQETSASSPYYIPKPDHEPPPIPPSANASAYGSRRTSGIAFDQMTDGSTLIDPSRASQDQSNFLETPQTHGSNSTEVSDNYFAQQTSSFESVSAKLPEDGVASSEKDRHRLIQRQNVIKELIDTEMVFVRDMNIVEEIYKGTAEACPRLDDQTVKLVFRNTTEIIEFHTAFLANLKTAVSAVYIPKGGRSPALSSLTASSEASMSQELTDAKDRTTSIGPAFLANIDSMKGAHEGFLRNSDQAAKKLIQIQQDPAVKLWLNECNEVAKDLTAAWDLDSLLIKPMQRITKYPNIIITLLQHTPQDHPDREPLTRAKDVLETAIIEINQTKKNFELVGQIVGRKRKDSDVRAGFARAFGKRVDKLQATNRLAEDTVYAKLNEKFGDDYLRLQVVLRDVEFYTRQVSAYVHEFLQYLSSVELVMRLQPGSYPELESKWVQFNISIRDLEKVALEDHLGQVRKHVIEPFELVIKAYGNPSLAMKKRQKRRLDFERLEQLKRGGRSIDSKLKENVEQYEALNDTLKKELPKLSALTESIGKICLGNFVNIQVKWFGLWKEKMKTVLSDCPELPDLKEIVATFQRDFPYAQEQVNSIGMLNPTNQSRSSLSTTTSTEDSIHKVRHRPADVDTRGRGISVNGDYAPTLPTPDFARMPSGSSSLIMSPGGPFSNVPSPHQYFYRDQYAGLNGYQASTSSAMSQEAAAGASKATTAVQTSSTRPSTGRSFESGGLPRQSSDSANLPRRDSHTTHGSNYQAEGGSRYSGLFQSAMPMSDTPEGSRRASRASSRERVTSDGYNVLWLAASLFEFNIATTKHEAGYPYLIYQAGEIFDVIAEKGELWLAKNQDDPKDQVGWIWSKHFAKLADA